MKNYLKFLLVFFRWLVCLLLLQTLYFKFTAHPESVALFSKLGVEPWGRISLGSVELIIAIGLLFKKTVKWASLFAALILMGAVFTHLFIIGVVVNNDGGLLFFYALIGAVFSGFLSFNYFRSSIINKL